MEKTVGWKISSAVLTARTAHVRAINTGFDVVAKDIDSVTIREIRVKISTNAPKDF